MHIVLKFILGIAFYLILFYCYGCFGELVFSLLLHYIF